MIVYIGMWVPFNNDYYVHMCFIRESEEDECSITLKLSWIETWTEKLKFHIEYLYYHYLIFTTITV